MPISGLSAFRNYVVPPTLDVESCFFLGTAFHVEYSLS